jgi:hypothetical protein
VEGRLLEPIYVEVLRGTMAHQQSNSSIQILLVQIQATLLLLRNTANEVRQVDPETSSGLAMGNSGGRARWCGVVHETKVSYRVQVDGCARIRFS